MPGHRPLQPGAQLGDDCVVHLTKESKREVPLLAGRPAQSRDRTDGEPITGGLCRVRVVMPRSRVGAMLMDGRLQLGQRGRRWHDGNE